MFIVCRNDNLILFSSFMNYHWIFKMCNTTDATMRTGTWYPSGTPKFTSSLVFSRFHIVSCVVFCEPLSSFLSCQCYDLQRLTSPLVSSNFSYIYEATMSGPSKQSCTSRPPSPWLLGKMYTIRLPHWGYCGHQYHVVPSPTVHLTLVLLNHEETVVGVMKSFLNIHIH